MNKWKKKRLIFAGLVLMLLAIWIVPDLVAQPESVSDEAAELVVAAYNLNFGLAGDPETLEALAGLEADVLLLQETNLAWQQSIEVSMLEHFPYQHWVDPRSYPAGGIAILSRLPLSGILVSASEIGWFDALRAVVVTEHFEVQVISVHLKPPVAESGGLVVGYFSTPSERTVEMQGHLDRLYDPNLPTIIGGDFNERSGGAIGALGELGFTDAIDRFAPGEPTWRWDLGVITLRQQLDHLMNDSRLRCLGAEIVDAGRSDHLPIVARYRMI